MAQPPLAAGTATGWSRLHPLTPLLRGGRALTALLALLTQQGLQHPSWRYMALAVVVVVPGAMVFGYLYWRTTRYRLTPTELQVDSGILRRRSRRVPLARLQSVDVVRPLVGRALGLSELRLEVAGGGRTEAPLAFLAEDQAHLLRARLLALAAGLPDPHAPHVDAPGVLAPSSTFPSATLPGSPVVPHGAGTDEAVLVQVPTRALVTSVLLSSHTIVTVLVLAVVVPLAVLRPHQAPGLLAAMAPALLASGGVSVRRVLAEYGFTVADSTDGLRLRHGLLETRAQSIPYGRVQTVRVTEPLLWRRRGWVRVEVDVAGYARHGGDGRTSTSALLPVAPKQFALTLVERVLGGGLPLEVDRPPPAARWRAPLSYRRLGLGLDHRHLVATSGVLTTTTEIVPLAKVQSLRLVQGPWQRALGLASLHVDSAGRRLRGSVARHRGAADAGELLTDLADRIRLARRRH